jgi:hypothetical protein
MSWIYSQLRKNTEKIQILKLRKEKDLKIAPK